MKDKKFILIGLDDDKTGYIAEVLKSKTAKKILDFLGDVKEASEKDISDALEMPLNTMEYNLKKLVKSGFVEKTKNFFWSVKGKKIPMYKLAKKHIIISPNKNPNINYLKSILPVFIAAIALIVMISMLVLYEKPGTFDEGQLTQFTSQQELNDFIQEGEELQKHISYSGGFLDGFGGIMREATTSISMAESAVDSSAGAVSDGVSTDDFSTTNIQVEGVDEADIVKNDGKYIYIVSNNKIIIVNAYPAEDMEILSEIKFEKFVNQIYINDNKLIVFGGYFGRDDSIVSIYDVSDRSNPILDNEIEYEGYYVNSRMIGDYVYLISNKYVNVDNPRPPTYFINGVREEVLASNVYYMPYLDSNYVFTNIAAININNGNLNNKVYLTGESNNIYVSQDNIYLTYLKQTNYENYVEDMAKEVYLPLVSREYDNKINEVLDSEDNIWEKLSEIREIVNDYSDTLDGDDFEEFSNKLVDKLEDFEIKIQKENEKTIIHKINIDKDEIKYKEKGEVPGRVLNQFSMDEHEGNFRIATTTGSTWRETSLNHLYILDKDLEILGSVEDLAPGERIYSTRFMGDRVYIVTFRQTDPFYVIDASDPENPLVLGYLKIPGYSSYLHPYDENHVIGLGKEGNQIKLSLFDVNDVENPIELDKYIIDKQYSSSDALNDHKAFLFDREKELLVIPVGYTERIVVAVDYADQPGRNSVTYNYWQGAYVFNLNLNNGFNLKGKISHNEGKEQDWRSNVRRSLYMDDTLYTISNKMVKANDLDDLDYIESVKWEFENDGIVYTSSSGMEENVEVFSIE